MSRVQTRHQLQLGSGLLEVTSAEQHFTQLEARKHVFGVQLGGASEILSSARPVAPVCLPKSLLIPRFCEVGIQLAGPLKSSRCGVILPCRLQCMAQRNVVARRVWMYAKHLPCCRHSRERVIEIRTPCVVRTCGQMQLGKLGSSGLTQHKLRCLQ